MTRVIIRKAGMITLDSILNHKHLRDVPIGAPSSRLSTHPQYLHPNLLLHPSRVIRMASVKDAVLGALSPPPWVWLPIALAPVAFAFGILLAR